MSDPIFRVADLLALAERRCDPSVSLFLPTHRAGLEVRMNPARLKNLLREATALIAERGFAPPEARDLLAPARALVDDPGFWLHQAEGLALFLAPGFFRAHRFALPLPERAVVGERFHLRPLLPLLVAGGRFYVLALSLNRVRLLEATREGVRRVDLAGRVPCSMEEALGYAQYDSALQVHAASPSVRLATQRGVVHGHGDSDSEAFEEDLLNFFHRLAAALERVLGDSEAPLILAAVAEYFSLYRRANLHPNLLPEGVPGNPELLSDGELAGRARALVEPLLLERREIELARYRELRGGVRTSTFLVEILPAAAEGRVEALFFDRGAEAWGVFEPAGGALEVHGEREPRDDDLLDAAAVLTLTRGGAVFVLTPEEMPSRYPAVALFRW